MVSFDVKSLFTSVPVDDAYAAIEQLVRADDHDGVRERTGMGTEAILRLLKLCMSITNFKFRNKHYAPADGLPMGSPASPVIANIYMRVFEEKALSTYGKQLVRSASNFGAPPDGCFFCWFFFLSPSHTQ